MTTDLMNGSSNAEAGPSYASGAGTSDVPRHASGLVPGASAYHESSQFRHWRYSPSQLADIRAGLNRKCVEVVARNQELEKEAQLALNHKPDESTPATAYLSTADEVLLLRFYCIQASKVCRQAFAVNEMVESTAITYLKRFYLKNSVMEWHPKSIMPTCLFLAAKTTNFPIPLDIFISRFAKLASSDILDTEFLVSQSLGFQFWIRGAEKALRGWYLEFQECPSIDIPTLARSLPCALDAHDISRLTDAEFLYTPSQVALACWTRAAPEITSAFLVWRYETMPDAYDMAQERLEGIVREIVALIDAVPTGSEGSPAGSAAEEKEKETLDLAKGLDMKLVKNVDKRLKMCTNPEKTPGTALYVKRKREREAAEAATRAAKSLKAAQSMSDRDSIFGGDLLSGLSSSATTTAGVGVGGLAGAERKPLSPRLTVPSPGGSLRRTPGRSGLSGADIIGGDRPGGGDVKIESTGMGVPAEGGGLLSAGMGIKAVGQGLDEDD